jgi:hypothetical protein
MFEFLPDRQDKVNFVGDGGFLRGVLMPRQYNTENKIPIATVW